MSEWVQPDNISVGAGVRMLSEEGVAKCFGCELEQARELLDSLGVPRVKYPTGPKKFVNLYALESLLFPLGLPAQFKNGPNNRNGVSDEGLIRLHQELAGVLYSTWTKEAVRARVKKLAKEMLNLPDKALTKPRKSATIRTEETKVYAPIRKGGTIP